MCHKLDKRFFDELLDMEPADVCRRALCRYDPELLAYEIEAWGHPYEVKPAECSIVPVEKEVPPVNTELGLSIIFYLMRARDLPLANEWISEKDLPGGVTFFRGPHAIPSHLIVDAFGDDVAAFRQRCEALSGTAVDLGDAGYVFRYLPRVPVAVLMWAGDDELVGEAKMLFDRTVSEHLPIDVVFGISEEVCYRLSRSHESALSWY